MNPNNNPPAAGGTNGFTPVQNAVLSVLKTATTPTGYSVTEICKQVKQFTESQVK